MQIPILPVKQVEKDVELWVNLDTFVEIPNCVELLRQARLQARYNKFTGILYGKPVEFTSFYWMQKALRDY